jgi:PAS domain S-box-containing protein
LKKKRHLDRLSALLLHPLGLPVLIGVALLSVNYSLLMRADSMGARLARSHSRSAAQQISARLRILISERKSDLEQLAAGYQSEPRAQRLDWFVHKATKTLAHSSLFHVINLIDSNHVIRAAVPRGKRLELEGLDLSTLPGRTRFHREAFRSTVPTASPALTLTSGRPGLVIWIPVRDERGDRASLIAGAVHIDEILDQALESVNTHQFHVEIDYAQERVFPEGNQHVHGKRSRQSAASVSSMILGRPWIVHVCPRDGASIQRLFGQNRSMFAIGVAIALAISGLLALALAVMRRNRKNFAAVAASEERFRRLSAAAPIGIFLADEQGATTWVNPAWMEISGLSADESRGLGFARVIHPEDREEMIEKWGRAVKEERGFEAEPRLVRSDGQRRWVHARAARMVAPSGDTLGYVGAILDITDRKQATLQIEQNEEKYRTLVEMFPHSITILQQGVVVFANTATLTMFGFERMEDVLGRDMFEVVAPSQRERLRSFAAARGRGESAPEQYETEMVRADGSEFPVEVIVRHITYFGKAAEQVITADVTDRKAAQEAIRQSEENLAVTLNSIGDAVIATDKAGAVARMNPIAEQLTGWSLEEARGLPLDTVFVVVNAFTREKVESPVSKVLREGKVVGLANHSIVVRRDGQERQIADSGAPIRNRNGEVIGVVLVFQDVTEHYKLEEQLRQAQKMEVVGRLAGGIAHDFNNLLSPILGYSEMALTSLDTASELYNDIQEIHQAAERARSLVSQLLAFSRKQILEIKPVELNKAVSDLRNLLKRIIGEDIQIALYTDPDSLVVMADPRQLEQIVLNLAVNARDAMAGGGVLTIETSRVEVDESFIQSHADMEPGLHALLTVTDTGEGMTPDVVKHIFEPFYTTKKLGEGTGLGLATVYGIIKQHHGGIWVYSEPDKGTTFKIYLPLRGNEKLAAPPQARGEAAGRAGKETILLVEDEPVVRTSARRILERFGYTVLEAANGEVAQTIAAEFTGAIHLMLTDVIMPDMNGRQLYAKICEIRPGIRVVYMSGYTENVIASRGVLEPGITFLQKPFTMDALTRKIREALSDDSPA